MCEGGAESPITLPATGGPLLSTVFVARSFLPPWMESMRALTSPGAEGVAAGAGAGGAAGATGGAGGGGGPGGGGGGGDVTTPRSGAGDDGDDAGPVD